MISMSNDFLYGSLIGMGSGLIGSFFVNFYFRWLDNPTSANLFVFAYFLLMFLFLFGVIWSVIKYTEKKTEKKKKR